MRRGCTVHGRDPTKRSGWELAARGSWSAVGIMELCPASVNVWIGDSVDRRPGRSVHRPHRPSRAKLPGRFPGFECWAAGRAGRPSRPVERLRLPAEEFPCSSSKSVFCMHSMHACIHACCASMHHILHIMHIRHITHITHICMYACVHACVHACMYVCEPRLPATGAGRPSWSAEPAGRALRRPSPHLNPPNEVF